VNTLSRPDVAFLPVAVDLRRSAQQPGVKTEDAIDCGRRDEGPSRDNPLIFILENTLILNVIYNIIKIYRFFWVKEHKYGMTELEMTLKITKW